MFAISRRTRFIGALAICNLIGAAHAGNAAVDDSRLLAAADDGRNWLMHGRTYDEQRFSPLTEVNDTNVGRLRLAWHYDLDAASRGQESTPLVIDGTMYVTTAWSKVVALDAKTGRQLWSFDPKVPGRVGVNACCDVVNRGVAAWGGNLYLGTLDGRLIAINAATGRRVWEVMTVPRGSRYTITGAPRVVKGKVLIGNGGAEMGVRGYISAYDGKSGRLSWRFYTVPGDPSKPVENPILRKAATTWTGEWWKFGGGGTVWDSIAYDPKLDLLYVGVGNGSPWNQSIRSPGGGDNLFLSSIVALRPETGEYVWHYQTTPGESWDFTATQHMILADLMIGGRNRPVLMQAPKNGFFYVLDRRTGELISAQPYTPVNWASGVDLHSGRPLENPSARYGSTQQPWLSVPGPSGAHNWQPMSYDPVTGLVYLPVDDSVFMYVPDRRFEPRQLAYNVGLDFDAPDPPSVPPAAKTQMYATVHGYLKAWDPVAQREVWSAPHDGPWNGGALSTRGNLVFEGTAMGELVAYRADNGERLWAAPTGAGVIAPPIAYGAGQSQFIAVVTGWGGAFGLAAGELALVKHLADNTPRVLAFELEGQDRLPAATSAGRASPAVGFDAPDRPELVTSGRVLYARFCSACHGGSAVSGGVLPDVRQSAALGNSEHWRKIVRDGALMSTGMVAFSSELTAADVENIRLYVIKRANDEVREAANSAPNGPATVSSGGVVPGR